MWDINKSISLANMWGINKSISLANMWGINKSISRGALIRVYHVGINKSISLANMWASIYWQARGSTRNCILV